MSQKTRFTRVLSSLLLLAVVVTSAQAGRFYVPATYPTGALPVAGVAFDFNHDGRLDLATANQDGDNISVLLGQTNGEFGAATDYPAGLEPVAIAAGDLNGDGNLDLAVVNRVAESVSLFLGNANGTFGNPSTLSAPGSPRDVGLADLDHDGLLDLLIALHGLPVAGEGWIAVRRGLGNGSFQNAVLYPAGQNPLHFAVADLNSDGNLDLAVADENETATPNDLAILLGRGDGTFPAPLLSRTNGVSTDLKIADLDGDGRLDLVIAGGETRTISVRSGNGDGTFRAARSTVTPGDALAVALAGLDGDGFLDLLVGGSNGVDVLLGRSGGNFRSPTAFGVGTRFVVPGDFNRDGSIDAVATADPSSISLALGHGDGTFAAARVYPVGTVSGGLAAGDFTRDGNVDLAVGQKLPTTLSILLGSTAGILQQGATFGAIEPSHLLAADFNRDKRLDLMVASSVTLTSGSHLYLGNGDGTFAAAQSLNPGTAPLSQVAADFDHDGRVDLATANSATDDMSILLGNGDGTFQAPVDYPAVRNPNVILAEDFDRDGNLDLAVNKSASARVGIFLGNGDGTFQTPLDLIAVATTMVSGDFNRDRNPDLILGNNPRLFLGNGDGTFQAGQFVSFDDGALQTSDINGDGKLDLLVASEQVTLLLGNGDGTFQAGVEYFSGGLVLGKIEIADANRDGAPDVMVTDRAENVSVLLNTGGSQVGLTSSSNPAPPGQPVTFTATITPTFPTLGSATGRVTFKEGNVVLGTGRVRQGMASFTTSDLAVGEHLITALYSGNDLFNQRTSPVLRQTIASP